jgi:hypothetical protein
MEPRLEQMVGAKLRNQVWSPITPLMVFVSYCYRDKLWLDGFTTIFRSLHR